MKLALKILLLILVVWIAGHALYRVIEPSAQSGVIKRLFTAFPLAGYSHVVAGSLALLLGACQMSSRLRRNNTSLHRKIGTGYVVCVLVSTIGAIAGLPSSEAPPSAIAGFWTLAIVWPIITLAGCPWKGKFDRDWHGKLMTYSYALTCAAVSLRLILIPLLISGMPFRTAYPIAAWGGGLGNVAIAFVVLRILKNRSGRSETGADQQIRIT